MIKIFVSIFFLALFSSCNHKVEEKTTNENGSKAEIRKEANISELLEIGMLISDLKKIFPNSSIEKIPAWKYGIDGGGDGYLIITNSAKELFYWPHWENPIVAGIIILNPKIKMKDGIHVGMTFKKYNSKYPNQNLQLDLISGFEYCYNKNLKYTIDFHTDDNNKLAEYEDMSSGEPGFSALLRPDATIDGISLMN